MPHGKKDFPQWEGDKMITPTMFPSWINFLKENGNKFLRRRDHEEQLSPRSNFFWGKGFKLPWGATSQMFEKKVQGTNFFQIKCSLYQLESFQNINIKNHLAFFIWGYKLNFMKKKKKPKVKFPNPIAPCSNLSFKHLKIWSYLFVSSQLILHNLKLKMYIIFYIYVLRAFQWYKEHLIWTKFTSYIFFSNI